MTMMTLSYVLAVPAIFAAGLAWKKSFASKVTDPVIITTLLFVPRQNAFSFPPAIGRRMQKRSII
jgi:hypothetical protein